MGGDGWQGNGLITASQHIHQRMSGELHIVTRPIERFKNKSGTTVQTLPINSPTIPLVDHAMKSAAPNAQLAGNDQAMSTLNLPSRGVSTYDKEDVPYLVASTFFGQATCLDLSSGMHEVINGNRLLPV